MAVQPAELDPLASWWQGLSDDPIQAVGSPAAPIVAPTPPPVEPAEIEMPAMDLRQPTIGFPRAVPEPAPVEMPPLDAQTWAPAMPEPAIGGLQPGLGIPVGAIDAFEPQLAHDSAVDARVAASETLSDDPLRIPTPEEATANRIDASAQPVDPRPAFESYDEQRASLSDYDAMLQDRQNAAAERMDDQQRSADALKQDNERRVAADQRHQEMRAVARAERAQIDRTDKTPNGRGARDLDVLPGPEGLYTRGMLAAALAGRVKALIVLEEDLVQDPSDLPVREALGKLELLVVTSLFPNQTTALAHAVIPALGFAEKTGSFTNAQGRIQRVQQALNPPGACGRLGEVLRAVAQHLEWDLGDIEPERVWAAIGEMPGPYHGIGWREWKAIGSEGMVPPGVPSAERVEVDGRETILPDSLAFNRKT